MKRTLLGKRAGASSRERVFRTADAIEVEEAEGYDVSRRRVFFDEILLVTYHQAMGAGFVAAMLVLISLFGFAGVLTLVSERFAGGLILAFTVLPLTVALLLRLLLKIDVITVFGPRTKAELHFWFRKAQARQAYQAITRLARDRQQRLRLSRRPSAPPPAPAMPPPPDPLVGS